MAERRVGPHVPAWPLTRPINGASADAHESRLWDCFGAYNGSAEVREQFAAHKEAILERQRSGELGPKGVEMALKKLAAEFEPRLRQLGELVDRARKHHVGVREQLTRREVEASKTPDEAVERALRRDRTIRRFEALSPTERNAAIRTALEKRDVNFLAPLLAEPGLLNDKIARAVEIELMREHKGLFGAYQELGGRLDSSGEVDPLTSPLAVAAFALDTTREFLESESGGPDPRTRLERAGALITDVSITLSPEAAHDPRSTARRANCRWPRIRS